jgi:ribosome maturation factor RimP
MGSGPFFVCAMPDQQYEWIERAVTGLGYEFVHLERVPRSGLFRVYIDKSGGVNVDDCATVSEHLSRAMTVEGIAYERLEISSPGLDRPLPRARDFERFVGEKARVTLKIPAAGRKTFTGRIKECSGGKVALTSDDGVVVAIDIANVEKARLVPSL